MQNLTKYINEGIEEYIKHLATDSKIDYKVKINILLNEISSTLGKTSYDWAVYHTTKIYNSFTDTSHQINHIGCVIGKALCILIDNPGENIKTDATKIFIAGLWHDLFTTQNRDQHHILAAEDILKYGHELNICPEDLQEISMMIYRHRASCTEKSDTPETHLEKILSDADRSYDITEFITRSISYHKSHSPNSEKEDIAHDVLLHLQDKYGTNGYAKFYIVDYNSSKIFNTLTINDILKLC